MKILAFSDLHGHWYQASKALIDRHQPDWIVLLGDILPDFRIVSGQGNRLTCQLDHWKLYASDFESNSVVTTFLRGNHEIEGFKPPPHQRRLPAGFEERVIRLEGIPTEFGTWGWSREWEEADLAQELGDQIKEAPQANIVLSHVPPYGCLDEVHPGTHIGHRPLAAWLESGSIGPHSLVLCGHVHESRGLARCGDSLVVNLAEGYALLDDQNDEGGWNRWRVLQLEAMGS
jgi:Icc-related predicted phosphoesterase